MSRDAQRTADLVEIQQLCARYMAFATEFVLDRWLEVFTPDVIAPLGHDDSYELVSRDPRWTVEQACELRIRQLREEFERTRPDAQIFLARVPEPERFGVAVLEGDRVVRLEYPVVPR